MFLTRANTNNYRVSSLWQRSDADVRAQNGNRNDKIKNGFGVGINDDQKNVSS